MVHLYTVPQLTLFNCQCYRISSQGVKFPKKKKKKGRVNHFMKGVNDERSVVRGRGRDASEDGVVIAPAAALASRGETLTLPETTQKFLRQERPVDLGEVTPSSIYNARKMREPDPMVLLVFSSVARLLHFRDLSWDGCRDMLARKDFVHMLLFTHPLDLNTESDGIPGSFPAALVVSRAAL